MITISIIDILKLSFSALIYGLLFAFISEAILFSFFVVYILFSSKSIESYDQKTDKKTTNFTKASVFFVFTNIFMFGMGFTIMSYIIVDGVLRFFPLAISVLAYKSVDILLLARLRTKCIKFLFSIREYFSKQRKVFRKSKKTPQTP